MTNSTLTVVFIRYMLSSQSNCYLTINRVCLKNISVVYHFLRSLHINRFGKGVHSSTDEFRFILSEFFNRHIFGFQIFWILSNCEINYFSKFVLFESDYQTCKYNLISSYYLLITPVKLILTDRLYTKPIDH